MTQFRVLNRTRQASAEWTERFRTLPVANISDVMQRMVAGGPNLRPYYAGERLCGPAITVKSRPGDNLMVHAALDLAQPGDVIVVDAGGDLTNAIIGELMVAYAAYKKLGGIVIYGAIRDSAELSAGSFPVFASGVTHRGPYKDGPGEVNAPIALEGMVIAPGDLICGDPDGVVSVPFEDLDRVHAAAKAKHEAETSQMEAIREGRNDRTWVAAQLQKMGCAMP
ncbi:RraA family protein [Devosia chinhatensis]|uniref:Putative 4-hydroxy-4-methyl-2-oxoglutarate aldolase n=1 Tax=Devosia chinhatensis TaxID=429727 RepID=A0A0F5FF46_9HYPH|nr:RraA family protein [Devosia chinhatensis]KKB07428.1 hypothetical protein VE26_11700 [Devosia chinhatensis]